MTSPAPGDLYTLGCLTGRPLHSPPKIVTPRGAYLAIRLTWVGPKPAALHKHQIFLPFFQQFQWVTLEQVYKALVERVL